MIKRYSKIKFSVVLLVSLFFAVYFAFPVGGFSGEYSDLMRDKIKSEYFSDNLVSAMKKDSIPILAAWQGINVFSSAQYGQRFVTGQVDIYDVFDARIKKNTDIFRQYAKENLLILNPSENEFYNRYALAATRFLKEFNYDAVLFYPDEYHPVFTNPGDTWMFIRESPVGETADGKYYYSSRIKNRRVAIQGGLQMEPLRPIDSSIYYIPKTETKYEPYCLVSGETVEFSSQQELINRFCPQKNSGEILEKRYKLGIVKSDFSGRKNVPVGAWASEESAERRLKKGFTFKGSGRANTWGDHGFYVIPLSKDFWEQRQAMQKYL